MRSQNQVCQKVEKFETCFRWVMYQHYYDTRRIFYNQTAWPALYANDYLILSGKGGDCFSDACSFAYLAKALGYTNIYVCVDTTATDGSGHCWAEIGGRVYDPLFAEAKSYYGYFWCRIWFLWIISGETSGCLTESSKSPAEVAKSNKQWVGLYKF